MTSRIVNYIIVAILIISFITSLYNIKLINDREENTERDINYKKIGRFVSPAITMISFFIACYFISVIIGEGEATGQDKYSGIFFMLIIGFILTIMNFTILGKNKLDKYIKGKKFSIVGLFMALGVSAIVFGFLDNFGIWMGIDKLNDYLPGGELTKAALGNTYSDMLGAIVGTSISIMAQDGLNYDDDNEPIWLNTIGILLGCLLGLVAGRLVTGKK